MRTMFGWFSPAIVFASRWKRFNHTTSQASVSAMIFTATARASASSVASHTDAIPPLPSRRCR